MKNRPVILTLLGTLFCLEPLARLLVLKIQGIDLVALGNALTGPYWFLNAIGLILFPTMGLALLHPGLNSRRVLIGGTFTYVGITSLFLKSTISTLSGSILLFYVLTMVITVALITNILSSPVAEVFKNSSIRWWEQAKRFKISSSTDIRPLVSNQLEDFTGTLLDISMEGAKLKSEDHRLEENDTLKLQTTIGEINLNLMARVAKVHQDKTLGLQFLSLNPERKKSLQKVLNSLEILETTLDRSRGSDLLVQIRQELLA